MNEPPLPPSAAPPPNGTAAAPRPGPGAEAERPADGPDLKTVMLDLWQRAGLSGEPLDQGGTSGTSGAPGRTGSAGLTGLTGLTGLPPAAGAAAARNPAGTGGSGGLRLAGALGRGLLDLIYPPCCPITGQDLAQSPNPWLARAVVEALPVLAAPQCLRCSAPLRLAGDARPNQRCRWCDECTGAFDRSVCLWEYSGIGRELILAFKFGGERQLAALLGAWLYAAGAARGLFSAVRWLAPVPGSQQLSSAATQENHATQLARAVAAADRAQPRPLGLEVWPEALHKIRRTQPQATLAREARLTEPAASLVCGDPARAAQETVVVVDDVLTTLATASEAARALTAAGARQVRLLALARTL
ncbi:MAG: ComF family protein [Planctomycetota bacterium]